MAAGFDPRAFWSLTPRLFDLHMRGAVKRIERDLDAQHRLAYHTAALSGMAMAGALPAFEEVFKHRRVQPPRAQNLAELEAAIMAIGINLGAMPLGLEPQPA